MKKLFILWLSILNGGIIFGCVNYKRTHNNLNIFQNIEVLPQANTVFLECVYNTLTLDVNRVSEVNS